MDIMCPPNTLCNFFLNVLNIRKVIDILLSHMGITWLWFTIQIFVGYLQKNLFLCSKRLKLKLWLILAC